MRYQFLFFLLLITVITMSGCGGNAFAAISPTSTTEVEAKGVEDQASLISALQGAGATVEVGDPITQPFFTPEGATLKVNGADVQVYEYESAEAMGNEASQVAADGGSIGTSMVNWMDTPHFYKAGRIIALYVGSDAKILGLLDKVIGPQFAGG
jgi:hypothetical protein